MARVVDPRPAPDLRYAMSGRRVRARLGGVDVVDSQDAAFVWEPRRPVPLYAFPRGAFRDGALEPTDAPPERAHPVREAFAVRAGDRLAEGAAWAYDDPDLEDHVVLEWGAMDAWFEEDEEVFVHPRDPYHRVDVRASSREVRIELDGSVVAVSRRPLILFETGLPTRFYIPAEDVQLELVGPTDTRTRCPYKGEAIHWSVRVGDRTHDDLAWAYPDPISEVARIRGLVAFYDERVDLSIDGERQQRPQTPWSHAAATEEPARRERG
jgi:uncharacterized protein (DUF427 family)